MAKRSHRLDQFFAGRNVRSLMCRVDRLEAAVVAMLDALEEFTGIPVTDMPAQPQEGLRSNESAGGPHGT